MTFKPAVAQFSYKDALLSEKSPSTGRSDTNEVKDYDLREPTLQEAANMRPGIIRVNQDTLNGHSNDVHVPFVWQKKRPTKEVQLFDYLSVATAAKKAIATKPQPAIGKQPLKKEVPRGNVLDKSAPELHKGKTREGKKRPTKTKRTVLEGREVRKSEESHPEIEPFSSKVRSYCDNPPSKELDASVLVFLSEIKRFQDRLWAKDPVKGRIKRRLVCGIRECQKQVGLHNAKCLIVATNIERIPVEGGLDDQIETLCNACREQELPVVFALTKNKLGRVIKKACVSCVAVLNFQGADNQYKTMLEEVEKCKNMTEQEVVDQTAADETDTEFLDQGIATLALSHEEEEEEQEQEDATFVNNAASAGAFVPPQYGAPYPIDFFAFPGDPNAGYITSYGQPVSFVANDGTSYFLPCQPYGGPDGDGYSYLAMPPPPFPYRPPSFPPRNSQMHNGQM